MKKLLLYVLFTTTLTGYSQKEESQKEFDSIYYEIAINISSSNPTKALHLADSLYIYASSDQQELRALMLSVEILEKQERHIEAMEIILSALKRAQKTQDYNVQAKIYGYLSTQSRIIGIMDEGKLYIERGIEVSKKMKTPEEIESYQAMARSELAEYAIDKGDYEEALELLELSLLYYKNLEDAQLKHLMKLRIQEVMARCYMGLKKPHKALDKFQTANHHLKQSGSEQSIFGALISQGLGEMFVINKQLDSAEIYLKKALTISEATNHNVLKELAYGSLASYYREKNVLDSAVYYGGKYTDMLSVNQQKSKRLTNAFYNRMPEDQPPSSESLNWWILSSGFLVILGGVFVLINKNVYGKLFIKDPTPKTGVKISLGTKRKLERSLKTFESSEKFLDPTMRFSTLVNFLDTNPKYLNHFLKTSLNTDYNTYINDLRINYVVGQLKNKPAYRKYKIGHLAKESGFSSHSNFSANFKRVTQLSPSEFIDEIKRES